jgi:hypothetical protein
MQSSLFVFAYLLTFFVGMTFGFIIGYFTRIGEDQEEDSIPSKEGPKVIKDVTPKADPPV